jgi:hypothetical protein
MPPLTVSLYRHCPWRPGGGVLRDCRMSFDALGPDDPGWRSALRGVWWVLIPGQLIRQQRKARQAGVNGLTVLRTVFLSFVAAFVMIEAVVLLISSTSRLARHPLPSELFAIVIVAFGIFALTVPKLLVERPLDCADDTRLAGTYRTRFFLRLAFADSVALLGFVGYVLTNRGWLYPLGAAFTAVGFLRLAPTRGNLAKDQETLGGAGCGRSLIGALSKLPPPSRSPRRR